MVATITNPKFLSHLTRQIRIREFRSQKNQESRHPGYLNMNETIPRKASFLVPPMPLVGPPDDRETATDVIEFTLKQKAGSAKAADSTYKLKVHRFNEGTVQDWIAVRKAFAELWKQNAITAAPDRVANITSILRGESLSVFDSLIAELQVGIGTDGSPTVIPLDDVIIDKGLEAVAETVFPFRALELQKQWMRRGMKKPKELSFRKTASAVGRLNNSLPLFPAANDSDKFSKSEVVELLEWSIPHAWRAKFDLAGFVPTQNTKERLITECEAIERNEPFRPIVKATAKPTANKKARTAKHNKGKKGLISPDLTTVRNTARTPPTTRLTAGRLKIVQLRQQASLHL